MKTDKELLELAAKAEGRTLKYMSVIDGKGNRIGEEFIACWNPLVDDGDAFRLAVKLELKVMVYHDTSQPKPWLRIETPNGLWEHAMAEEFESNPYAATRRAIVRAAAAIGETM